MSTKIVLWRSHIGSVLILNGVPHVVTGTDDQVPNSITVEPVEPTD